MWASKALSGTNGPSNHTAEPIGLTVMILGPSQRVAGRTGPLPWPQAVARVAFTGRSRCQIRFRSQPKSDLTPPKPVIQHRPNPRRDWRFLIRSTRIDG